MAEELSEEWALAQQLSELLPADVTVGWGLKEVGGELTDTVALVAYVPEKLPLEELTGLFAVPPEFEGLPTDVVEWRPTTVADTKTYQVMHGGIEIGAGSGSGTLGAIVQHRQHGQSLMLSCQHVVGAAGTSVHQPDGGRMVGTVLQSTSRGDCGSVAPAEGVQTTATVEGVGRVRQSRHLDPNVIIFNNDLSVKKRGRTTLLTHGTIQGIKPQSGFGRPHELHIRVPPGDPPFCLGGDSGSAVLNAQNEVVGLLYASVGPQGLVGPGGSLVDTGAVATCIQDVEAVLDVEVTGNRAAKPRRASAYFFKGAQCGRWDTPTDYSEGALAITDHFRHMPTTPFDYTRNIDAAVAWGNGKAYFFQGAGYIRWDMASALRDVGPAPISRFWKDFWFPGGIDAAINWGDGNAYFFKDGNAGRWDIGQDLAAEGPHPIAHFFPGFPAEFAGGIDAALNWGNGKVYFFKGARYARFDQASGAVDVGPVAITRFWPDFPFPNGVDSAVTWFRRFP